MSWNSGFCIPLFLDKQPRISQTSNTIVQAVLQLLVALQQETDDLRLLPVLVDKIWKLLVSIREVERAPRTYWARRQRWTGASSGCAVPCPTFACTDVRKRGKRTGDHGNESACALSDCSCSGTYGVINCTRTNAFWQSSTRHTNSFWFVCVFLW